MNKVYDRPFLTFEQQLNHFYKNNKINKRNIKQLLTKPRFRLNYFE